MASASTVHDKSPFELLPMDILSHVVAYLDMEDIFSSLRLLGSRHLYSGVLTPYLHRHLHCSSNKQWMFPRHLLLSRCHSLTSLTIIRHEAPLTRFDSHLSWLTSLPPSLEIIHFQFQHAQNIWMTSTTSYLNDKYRIGILRTPKKKTDLARQFSLPSDFVPIRLNNLVPNLKILILLGSSWHQFSTTELPHNASWNYSLGPPPIRGAVWTSENHVEFTQNLPRSLNHLEFGVLPNLPPGQTFDFPPSLTVLRMHNLITIPPAPISSAFKNIENNDTESGQLKLAPGALVKDLKWGFFITHTNRVSRTSSMWDQSSVPFSSLESLSIHVSGSLGIWCDKLPHTLKHFCILQDREYNSILNHFNIVLPDGLETLIVRKPVLWPTNYPLPNSLKTLELATTVPPEFFKTLPSGLVSLHILPDNTSSYHIYLQDVVNGLTKTLQTYVPNLTYLTFHGFCNHLENDPKFPSHLTYIRLDFTGESLAKSFVKKLPRCLTFLRITENLDIGPDCIGSFSPELKTLILPKNMNFMDYHVQKMPSLTKLELLTIGISGRLFPQNMTVLNGETLRKWGNQTFGKTLMKNSNIRWTTPPYRISNMQLRPMTPTVMTMMNLEVLPPGITSADFTTIPIDAFPLINKFKSKFANLTSLTVYDCTVPSTSNNESSKTLILPPLLTELIFKDVINAEPTSIPATLKILQLKLPSSMQLKCISKSKSLEASLKTLITNHLNVDLSLFKHLNHLDLITCGSELILPPNLTWLKIESSTDPIRFAEFKIPSSLTHMTVPYCDITLNHIYEKLPKSVTKAHFPNIIITDPGPFFDVIPRSRTDLDLGNLSSIAFKLSNSRKSSPHNLNHLTSEQEFMIKTPVELFGIQNIVWTYHFQASHLLQLPPNIKFLSLGKQDTIESNWISYLPPKMISLDCKSIVPNYDTSLPYPKSLTILSTGSGSLQNLPPKLRQLSIDRCLQFLNDDLSKLPKSLTWLCVGLAKTSGMVLKNMPASVTYLDLSSCTGIVATDILNIAPTIKTYVCGKELIHPMTQILPPTSKVTLLSKPH